MAKSKFDQSPITKSALSLADELNVLRRDTSKQHVTPPAGMERIPPAELRKRWPTMGESSRRKVRESLATDRDPAGIDALVSILRPDHNTLPVGTNLGDMI